MEDQDQHIVEVEMNGKKFRGDRKDVLWLIANLDEGESKSKNHPLYVVPKKLSTPPPKPKRSPSASNSGQSWAESDDAFIKEKYPTLGPKKVARELGRTRAAVAVRASFLGVKKLPKFPAPY